MTKMVAYCVFGRLRHELSIHLIWGHLVEPCSRSQSTPLSIRPTTMQESFQLDIISNLTPTLGPLNNVRGLDFLASLSVRESRDTMLELGSQLYSKLVAISSHVPGGARGI